MLYLPRVLSGLSCLAAHIAKGSLLSDIITTYQITTVLVKDKRTQDKTKSVMLLGKSMYTSLR